MGTWLTLATRLFAAVPSATQRHAILLTDGYNQHESPEQLSAAIEGAGPLPVRLPRRRLGVQVAEVAGLRPRCSAASTSSRSPSEAADFEQIMRQSMGRGVADAALRVWAPQGSQVLFVRQVSPTVEDLSSRRQEVNPLTGAYATGAWVESRYHVAVRPPAKAVGQEQLAARVQVAVADAVVAQGRSGDVVHDDTLNHPHRPWRSRTTPAAGRREVIQDGRRREGGGLHRRRCRSRRAVQLAEETGNDEATTRLRRSSIRGCWTGTVRLKRSVSKLDEMALYGIYQDDAGQEVSIMPMATSTASDDCDTCGVPIRRRPASDPAATGCRPARR